MAQLTRNCRRLDRKAAWRCAPVLAGGEWGGRCTVPRQHAVGERGAAGTPRRRARSSCHLNPPDGAVHIWLLVHDRSSRLATPRGCGCLRFGARRGRPPIDRRLPASLRDAGGGRNKPGRVGRSAVPCSPAPDVAMHSARPRRPCLAAHVRRPDHDRRLPFGASPAPLPRRSRPTT